MLSTPRVDAVVELVILFCLNEALDISTRARQIPHKTPGQSLSKSPFSAASNEALDISTRARQILHKTPGPHAESLKEKIKRSQESSSGGNKREEIMRKAAALSNYKSSLSRKNGNVSKPSKMQSQPQQGRNGLMRYAASSRLLRNRMVEPSPPAIKTSKSADGDHARRRANTKPLHTPNHRNKHNKTNIATNNSNNPSTPHLNFYISCCSIH
jgi:hypothetical protein